MGGPPHFRLKYRSSSRYIDTISRYHHTLATYFNIIWGTPQLFRNITLIFAIFEIEMGCHPTFSSQILKLATIFEQISCNITVIIANHRIIWQYLNIWSSTSQFYIIIGSISSHFYVIILKLATLSHHQRNISAHYHDFAQHYQHYAHNFWHYLWILGGTPLILTDYHRIRAHYANILWQYHVIV